MTSRFWVGLKGDEGSSTIVPDDDEGLTKAEATGRRLKLIEIFNIPKEDVVLIAVYEEACPTSTQTTEKNISLQSPTCSTSWIVLTGAPVTLSV